MSKKSKPAHEIKQTPQFAEDFEHLTSREREKTRRKICTLDISPLPLDDKNVITMQETEDINIYLLGDGLSLVFKKTEYKLYLLRVADIIDIYEWSVQFTRIYDESFYPDED